MAYQVVYLCRTTYCSYGRQPLQTNGLIITPLCQPSPVSSILSLDTANRASPVMLQIMPGLNITEHFSAVTGAVTMTLCRRNEKQCHQPKKCFQRVKRRQRT